MDLNVSDPAKLKKGLKDCTCMDLTIKGSPTANSDPNVIRTLLFITFNNSYLSFFLHSRNGVILLFTNPGPQAFVICNKLHILPSRFSLFVFAI